MFLFLSCIFPSWYETYLLFSRVDQIDHIATNFNRFKAAFFSLNPYFRQFAMSIKMAKNRCDVAKPFRYQITFKSLISADYSFMRKRFSRFTFLGHPVWWQAISTSFVRSEEVCDVDFPINLLSGTPQHNNKNCKYVYI